MIAGLLFSKTISALVLTERVLVVPATPDGEAREIARSAVLEGLSWLPSGSGVVYSSSSGSTVLYPPTFNLRSVERDGTGDRQLTFGDQSYVEPDVHMSGMLAASRIRTAVGHLEISGQWVAGREHAPRIRITHQTGHAQTPSISPDESEVVYLSDAGGHGNLWIARTDGSGVRQITFERNPTTSVGVPMWSPAGNRDRVHLDATGGNRLVARQSRRKRPPELGHVGLLVSLVDRRPVGVLLPRHRRQALHRKDRNPRRAGDFYTVRQCQLVSSYADGSVLYFVNLLIKSNGIVDHEIGRAHPENGPSDVLARVTGSRVPVMRRALNPVLSPNGQWLTFPLTDGGTSNIWGLPTNGEAMRPFTDFADRSVVIARRVSWSPDNNFLYAAVAETDADVVVLAGLLR